MMVKGDKPDEQNVCVIKSHRIPPRISHTFVSYKSIRLAKGEVFPQIIESVNLENKRQSEVSVYFTAEWKARGFELVIGFELTGM